MSAFFEMHQQVAGGEANAALVAQFDTASSIRFNAHHFRQTVSNASDARSPRSPHLAETAVACVSVDRFRAFRATITACAPVDPGDQTRNQHFILTHRLRFAKLRTMFPIVQLRLRSRKLSGRQHLAVSCITLTSAKRSMNQWQNLAIIFNIF